MISVGIDPGLSGAIAVIVDGEAAEVFDMPVKPYGAGYVKTVLDVGTLATELWWVAEAHRLGVHETRVHMERVAGRPGQGVSSVFSFGMSYWGCAGVVEALGLPLNLILPTEWKAHFRLGKDKEASRRLARQRFPEVSLGRKKDHGRAEALLIAAYGTEKAQSPSALPSMSRG